MVSYILLYAVVMSLILKLIEGAFEPKDVPFPENENTEAETVHKY